MSLYLGRLIIVRIFGSEIWEAYFREGYLFIYLFILFYFIFFFWGVGLLSEFYSKPKSSRNFGQKVPLGVNEVHLNYALKNQPREFKQLLRLRLGLSQQVRYKTVGFSEQTNGLHVPYNI